MIGLLLYAVIGLSALLGLLIVDIVVRRFLRDRRQARERLLRPEIEVAMAGYLAGDDPEPPPFPPSREARALLRAVALDALTELRGGERQRLVELLERAGVVADTAVELRSHRVRLRREAAESLGYMTSAEAAESLQAGLRDNDLDVRVSSASALAELADQEPDGILREAEEAAAERPGAAAAILLTLGRRNPSSLGVVLAPSPDVSLELRRLAAAVVGGLRLAEHASLLRQALGDEDDELVSRAARGLGLIGDADAVDSLLALMEERDREWFVRLAAASALGAIGDPRASSALERELYTEGDGWALQSKAADALRLLGEKGEEVLRRALYSRDASVRGHAKVALEQ